MSLSTVPLLLGVNDTAVITRAVTIAGVGDVTGPQKPAAPAENGEPYDDGLG